MCFSAEVSFTASAGLLAIGVKTISENQKETRLLSYIPIIFAIHQFAEGMNWMLYYESSSIKTFFNYLYTYIEYCFWPFYIPLSLYFIKPNQNLIKKKIIGLIFILGLIYSLYWIYYIVQSGVVVYNTCQPDCGGLSYIVQFPREQLFFSKLFYLMTVSGTMILSSLKANKIYGVLVAFAWIIANEYFLESFGSIWCFFAGVLSVVIYMSIKEYNKIKV